MGGYGGDLYMSQACIHAYIQYKWKGGAIPWVGEAEGINVGNMKSLCVRAPRY